MDANIKSPPLTGAEIAFEVWFLQRFQRKSEPQDHLIRDAYLAGYEKGERDNQPDRRFG